MTVEVLVIEPDGSQHIELQELPDNWFDAPAAPTEEDR